MSLRAVESSGPDCQGSSAVEQATHKSLVVSSILPPGIFFHTAWITSFAEPVARHYMGSAIDLDARLAQHLHGHTAITKWLGASLEIPAKNEVPLEATAADHCMYHEATTTSSCLTSGSNFTRNPAT